jgi:hypothetical protein
VQLDHVYCFVTPGFPQEPVLKEAGLTVGFGRQHAGQGTENRLLLLNNAYLELIWIRDQAEAARNPLRLDRRWAPGGAVGCPFGIGLRGQIPGPIRKDFFEYHLEGFPGRLWIQRHSNEDGMLPMVFVIEPPDGDEPVTSPRDQGFPPALFEHPCGAAEIERVTIYGPDIEDLNVPTANLPIDRWPDRSWRMDVEIASTFHRKVEVLPHLHLLLRQRGPGIVGPNDPVPGT